MAKNRSVSKFRYSKKSNVTFRYPKNRLYYFKAEQFKDYLMTNITMEKVKLILTRTHVRFWQGLYNLSGSEYIPYLSGRIKLDRNIVVEIQITKATEKKRANEMPKMRRTSKTVTMPPYIYCFLCGKLDDQYLKKCSLVLCE